MAMRSCRVGDVARLSGGAQGSLLGTWCLGDFLGAPGWCLLRLSCSRWSGISKKHGLGNSWQTAIGSQRWRKPGGGRFWKVPYPPCPMESGGGCWQTPGPGTPSPPGSPAIWRSTSSSFPLLYLLAHEAKRAVAKQTKLKPSGLIATSD